MTTQIQAGPFKILSNDPMESSRAKSYYTKEPGTLAWLAEIQPGEVIYDIGANIGLYALTAAAAVGPAGAVYAFEPHVMNATSLIRNVRLNGFEDRVQILTCPLGAEMGIQPFYYMSKRAGTSGSQLGTAIPAPGAVELKSVVTLDWMQGYIRPPDRIKIDVDGHEPEILRGGLGLLASGRRISVQVEIDPARRCDVEELMEQAGYRLSYRHYTSNGQVALDAGAAPELVIHNAVYTRAA